MTSKNDLSKLVAREASFPVRLRYTALLLAGTAMAALVGLLWATEPGLPVRTQISFGAMVLIGLGWATFAAWVLARRRPLFALDRVVAGWMALAASLLVSGIGIVIAAARSSASLTAVISIGAVAISASSGVLWRASRRRRALQARLANID